MLFAHGFGCDQNMWRFVTPAFEDDYRIVLFDYVGSGKSDLARVRRRALRDARRLRAGRARRLPRARPARRDLRRPLGEQHGRRARRESRARSLRAPRSSSARRRATSTTRRTTSAASSARTSRAARDDGQELHRLGELPRAGDHEESRSPGARRGARGELLLDRSGDRAAFAEATFFADNRADLPQVRVPSLILQCSDDMIAPRRGRRLRASRASPGSTLRVHAGDRPLPAHEPPRGDDRAHARIPRGTQVAPR